MGLLYLVWFLGFVGFGWVCFAGCRGICFGFGLCFAGVGGLGFGGFGGFLAVGLWCLGVGALYL